MEKQLPKNWVEIKFENIGEATDFVANGSFQSLNENVIQKEDPDYAILVRLKDFSSNWKGNFRYVTKESYEFLKKSSLVKGDLFIANVGYPGKLFLVPDLGQPMTLGPNGLRVRANSISSNVFLKYYYLSPQGKEEINKIVSGTAQQKFNKTGFRQSIIPLPPQLEQNRIITKLDTLFVQLETIKTSMTNIPLLLKNFRQQVLTQAVTGKLTEQWRKGKELENGEDFIKRVIKLRKEKESKKLPGLEFKSIDHPFDVDDSWSFGFLQNFGEFTRGKSKHRPRNDNRLFGGDFPFIQTGEVSRSNGLITNYKNTYSEFGLAQSRLFPKGTLCITIAANIAETGILDFDACFPDSVVGYLPFENYYSSKFAMFYFNTIQKDLEHYAPATAQKNINLGILFEVPFPVPPFEEQQEIVNRVESLFAKADAIGHQFKVLKEKIDTLPQAILHKAFKGELTEQLDSDGDARDLLKEIKELKAQTAMLSKKKQNINI